MRRLHFLLAGLLLVSLLLFGAASPIHGVVAGGSGDWDDAAIDAFAASARAAALERAAALGIEVPADFLAWIDADRVRRLSVDGCRADPLPVLLALRSLELDLGSETVRRDYPELALAFAIQDSYVGRPARGTPWNDADTAKPPERLPDLTPRPRLTLEIPGDPRVPIDVGDPSRPRDRDDQIIAFLDDHPEIEVEVPVRELPPLEYDERGVAKPRGEATTVVKRIRRPLVAADVIASAELQRRFNAHMRERGHPEVSIDCGDGAVRWSSTDAVQDATLRERIRTAHELFLGAYRATGRLPRERDRSPTAAESMAWFVRNDRDRSVRTGAGSDRVHPWPMFPLDAPWPILLMLAADDQPLREREEVWRRFRDQDEFRTYGEYIGGIAQQFDMQSARRLSPFPFDYGSIQMMWKDGGVCGTMGNIGARTYRICGVPASTAGQPGHCAIVFWERDPATGAFACRGGQYATGGDEVTSVHAGWNYDDVGGRRPMAYHQSIGWGVNRGAESLIETLVLRRMWDRLPAERRRDPAEAIRFAAEATRRNPFALAAVEGAMQSVERPDDAVAILDAVEAALAAQAGLEVPALYLATLREIARARVTALAASTATDVPQAVLDRLERR